LRRRDPENEIVGEALVALKHDELKEMGITSVGHRLTILKAVYEMKIKQDVPIDPDHYIPLCAYGLISSAPLLTPLFSNG
jgi:protein STE50